MIDEAFARHERIALQFSGGKDSLAILYVMQPYWDRLTVYFCNSGNPMPETMDLVERVRAMVPRFEMIMGRQLETVGRHGFPSELVPYWSTPFGRDIAGDTGYPMIDRYGCCANSIMLPMHDRMKADGITLIIRGQRNADEQKSTMRSGMTQDGIEVLFPIEDWSDDDVFTYLRESGVDLPRFYTSGMSSAPDCLNCTAWLKHGLPAYLKAHHPQEYWKLQARLRQQIASIEPVLDMMASALEKDHRNGF